VAWGALAELKQDRLVTETAGPGEAPVTREVSPEGHEVAERLIATRRAAIAELCEGWPSEENPDLAALLTRLARELLRQAPDREPASAAAAAPA
jgi:DNA-binding MarR family transcriptional regulator